MPKRVTKDLQAEIREINWFHSIDLGDGTRTPGPPDNPVLTAPGALPDVTGRTVLDIGAWDGKWSFWAEQHGASRVISLDHYAWRIDWAKRTAYWAECEREGRLPDHDRDEVDFWSDGVPGRRGFDLARTILKSKAEPVVADFMTVDLADLGQFDVVFYFGVLYHMREPLVALQRLRRVTRGVAAIETEAVVVPGHESASLMMFYPGNELNRDYGNWYAHTEVALHGMCRAAGFSRIETRVGASDRSTQAASEPVSRYRIVVHAYP
ncbi:MAG: DUF1698 domain-containing protein [Acidimicrobiaceae bacterium]|nr:DUF1698 domain-containing protein [Acidimicrobiaceae bacterium]